MSTATQNPNDLSTEELEAILQKRRAEKRKKLAQEKKKYEASRDDRINQLVPIAKVLSKELTEFKKLCHTEMTDQATQITEYGKMRSNSKGGFSITNSDNTLRIVRRRDTEPKWDERSQKAVTLIKDFLSDTIKKKDLKLYEILLSFLERNKNGELEYSRVMDLYKHEDKYADPRWTEGLRLIKESFGNHLKGFGYEFKTKNEEGKWETLQLNFSGV